MKNKLLSVLTLFCLLVSVNNVFSQSDSNTEKKLSWHEYWALPAVTFKNVRQEISPWTFGAVGISTILLYPNRQSVNNYFRTNLNNTAIESVTPYITNLGLGYVNISVAGTLYILGQNREKEAARMCIESFLLSGIQVQLIKHIVGEERPGTPEPHLGPSIEYDSFPSGHTSNIFSLATVLTGVYGKPALFYSAATLVGLSRIYENAHWLHDVIGGAVIGYTAGKYVLHCHRENKPEQITWEFGYIHNNPGLILKMEF